MFCGDPRFEIGVPEFLKKSKASPFGRGGIACDDGEGKSGAKVPLCSDRQKPLAERCYRRAYVALSASLPSQALRASSPKGRAFWIHLYYILPYFPPCHKAKWPENSQNGQKSRKNAWYSLCRRPSEPKNTGEKTPESPKIPLQLGCSVTQIRHFFKRTFFNLPLIFENNVKKATVWLHERLAEAEMPLPLGEVSPKVTERARMLTVI